MEQSKLHCMCRCDCMPSPDNTRWRRIKNFDRTGASWPRLEAANSAITSQLFVSWSRWLIRRAKLGARGKFCGRYIRLNMIQVDRVFSSRQTATTRWTARYSTSMFAVELSREKTAAGRGLVNSGDRQAMAFFVPKSGFAIIKHT